MVKKHKKIIAFFLIIVTTQAFSQAGYFVYDSSNYPPRYYCEKGICITHSYRERAKVSLKIDISDSKFKIKKIEGYMTIFEEMKKSKETSLIKAETELESISLLNLESETEEAEENRCSHLVAEFHKKEAEEDIEKIEKKMEEGKAIIDKENRNIAILRKALDYLENDLCCNSISGSWVDSEEKTYELDGKKYSYQYFDLDQLKERCAAEYDAEQKVEVEL